MFCCVEMTFHTPFTLKKQGSGRNRRANGLTCTCTGPATESSSCGLSLCDSWFRRLACVRCCCVQFRHFLSGSNTMDRVPNLAYALCTHAIIDMPHLTLNSTCKQISQFTPNLVLMSFKYNDGRIKSSSLFYKKQH